MNFFKRELKMDFLNPMGGSGLGFQAKPISVAQPVTQPQTDQAYANTQTGLQQQQAFLNALQAQNGIQNQSSVFNQQQGLANQLQGVANGTGPNPALDQLNQQTGNNVANQAALMAGQRGSSANPALIAQLAARQGAATQQQAAGQGATLQAQQQLGGMQALGAQQQALGNTAGAQVGQQANATTGYNQAAQSEQQNLLNATAQRNTSIVGQQNGINSVNGGQAGNQGAAQAGMIGGLASAASNFFAQGGTVQPQHYAMGGQSGQPVSPQGKFLYGSAPKQDQQMGDAADAAQGTNQQQISKGFNKTGNSLGGKGLNMLMGGSSGMAPSAGGSLLGVDASSLGGGTAAGGQSVLGIDTTLPSLSEVGSGISNVGEGFGQGLQGFVSNLGSIGSGLGTAIEQIGASGAGQAVAGGAEDVGAAAAADAPEAVAVAYHGGTINTGVPVKLSPGERKVSPWEAQEIASGNASALSASQRVPGKSPLPGDNPKNDIINDRVQPGTIIIPHSVLSSKDPGEAEKQYVLQQLKKSPQSKSNFDDGGGVADALQPDLSDVAVERAVENAPASYDQTHVPAATQFMRWAEQNSAAQAPNPYLPEGIPQGKPAVAMPPPNEAPKADAQPARDAPPANTPPERAGDPYGYQAMSNAYGSGLGQQQAGIRNEANALGAQSKAQAQAVDQGISQQQALKDQYLQEKSARDQDIQAVMADVKNGHIDPEQYIKGLGTGGKIANAIGLILGGISAGVNHTSNPAMDVLQAHINNNIRAQEADMGNRKTLLEANFKRYGNMEDAMKMTSAMNHEIIADQVQSAGLKSNDPVVQARAQVAAGQLRQQSAQMVGQMAMRSTLAKGTASGQLDPAMTIRMMGGEKTEPLMKDLQSMQNMVRLRDNALSAFDQLNQTDTIGNRLLSPLQTPKQVNAIRGPILAQMVKDSEGRITPQDVPMIGAMFETLGAGGKSVSVQRKRLNDFLTQKMNFPSLSPMGIRPETMGKYDMGGKKRIAMGPVR